MQILAETVDTALWKALRIEQGSELAPPDLRDQKRLSAALDAAAGTARTGEGDESLYDAAHAEVLEYFTESGAERKDFRRQGEESSAAALAAEELRRRLAELGEDIESSESLMRQRNVAEPELARLREVAGVRRKAVDALAGLDQAVTTAEAKLDAARKQLGMAGDLERRASERSCVARLWLGSSRRMRPRPRSSGSSRS